MSQSTEINSFDDLLRAARAHPERHRLLLVFVAAELPDEATPEQRARFAQGEGGALVPLMCVDKAPQELDDFEALLQESRQLEAPGQSWQLVFTAALAGTLDRAPTDAQVEQVLQRMVQ